MNTQYLDAIDTEEDDSILPKRVDSMAHVRAMKKTAPPKLATSSKKIGKQGRLEVKASVGRKIVHIPTTARKPKESRVISKILGIYPPKAVRETKRRKLKFGIEVVYVDGTGKRRTRTVLFGRGDEYYFNGDEIKRVKSLNRSQSREHVLDGKFWRDMLLNNKEKNFDVTFPPLRALFLK